jgi:hypothetical protein
MKTKLSTIIILAGLYCSSILTSCNQNNPQPNPNPNTTSANSVTAMWQGTIDGNSYNYTGTYINLISTSNYMNNPGRADGTYLNVNLEKGVIPGTNGNPITMALNFPANVNPVGTHILDSSNNSYLLSMMCNNGSSTAWIGNSLSEYSNITLNITEFPSNIGGLIKGNFSGVLLTSKLGSSNTNDIDVIRAVSISFEAIRKY